MQDMTRQTFAWNRYPETKPPVNNKLYMITRVLSSGTKFVYPALYDIAMEPGGFYCSETVEAWAEQPEPFSSGKAEDRIDDLLYALNDSFLKILESYDETTSKGSDCMDEAYCGGLVKGFQIALRTFGFEADEKARTITFREES